MIEVTGQRHPIQDKPRRATVLSLIREGVGAAIVLNRAFGY